MCEIEDKIHDLVQGAMCFHSFKIDSEIHVNHLTNDSENKSELIIILKSENKHPEKLAADNNKNNDFEDIINNVSDNINNSLEKPDNIPDNINSVSKKGKKEFVSFDEARSIVKSMGIKTQSEYKKMRTSGKYPKLFQIPHNLDVKYKDHWHGWNHFIGHLNKKNSGKYTREHSFITYEEAKNLMAQLNIKSAVTYNKLTPAERNKHRLPSRPDITYKEWISWPEFLRAEKK